MDRKSLKLKIPSINHIFGQSIDQVEKFCLARAYTDYAFWLYYDVSSFISDASISEKIAYKSESIDRLACALENFEKSYQHWSTLDRCYASAFETYIKDQVSLIDYAKSELDRNVKFDEDVELSRLLNYSNEELSAALSMIDILPVDHLDSLFGEVNKATSVLFDDILLNINTDDFDSLHEKMSENFSALDECLTTLREGYKKYISQDYINLECMTILKYSKKDLVVFDQTSILFNSLEDVRLLFAAWHHHIFLYMLLSKMLFSEREETLQKVDLICKKGIPDSINRINALGFSMSSNLLSYLDLIRFEKTMIDFGDVRSEIKETGSFTNFFNLYKSSPEV